MSMKTDEIIRVAQKLELDGREFYLKAAALASNQSTRTAFESLATDELHHLEWINKMYPDVKPAEVNKNLYDRVKGIFVQPSQEVQQNIEAAQDDIAAMREAIEMEQKAIDAYSRWANESIDDDAKNLCTKLVTVEQFHRQLLENMITYLEQPDQWFQQDENWSFDGGTGTA